MLVSLTIAIHAAQYALLTTSVYQYAISISIYQFMDVINVILLAVQDVYGLKTAICVTLIFETPVKSSILAHRVLLVTVQNAAITITASNVQIRTKIQIKIVSGTVC